MSGCVDQSRLKKYRTRKSPPYPANKCRGSTKVGNDGQLWTSVPNILGVHRWRRAGAKRKPKPKPKRRAAKPKRKPKPCRKDQIRNPASGRCVKRSGKVGRSIRGKPNAKRNLYLVLAFYDDEVENPFYATTIDGKPRKGKALEHGSPSRGITVTSGQGLNAGPGDNYVDFEVEARSKKDVAAWIQGGDYPKPRKLDISTKTEEEEETAGECEYGRLKRRVRRDDGSWRYCKKKPRGFIARVVHAVFPEPTGRRLRAHINNPAVFPGCVPVKMPGDQPNYSAAACEYQDIPGKDGRLWTSRPVGTTGKWEWVHNDIPCAEEEYDAFQTRRRSMLRYPGKETSFYADLPENRQKEEILERCFQDNRSELGFN